MTRGSVVLFVFCLLPLSLASTARAQTRCASTAGERDGALSIEGTEYAARPRPDAWRQLGGPHRNFRVDSAAVATAWGAGGPTRLWSRSLGEGYSSILADGDLLMTMYPRNGLQVHARAAVLTSNAWTPPTLVGSTLYVRDRHQILALDLDDPSTAAAERR